MTEKSIGRRRAMAVGAPIIAAVVISLFVVSYLFSGLLGFPVFLGLPVSVRLVGGAIVASGLAVIAWAMRQRGPGNVIASTYVTLVKALRRIPSSEMAGRTEPLVVGGPQRYTRNPLYFGVIVMVFGWALLTTYSFVFVATVVLLVWFGIVLIPLEERELRALFGDEWAKYSKETPMLIPFTKRRKHSLDR